MGRTLWTTVALVATLWIGAGPVATAQEEGACSAFFNGVEVSRIDGIDTPLELRTDDVLTFHGVDEAGTQSAEVEVVLVSVSLDGSTTTYGPLEQEFQASLDLQEVEPYGVGLYRVRGATDNCTAEGWIRISGRYPFATLTGLTAGGLALAGFAGQLASIASRRRWSPVAAALAGVATGSGGAVIAQQFGRLQLSYPAMAGSVGAAAVLGAGLALLIRRKPAEGGAPGFLARRREAAADKRAIRYQARLEAARLEAARRDEEAERAAEAPGTEAVAEEPAPWEPPAGRTRPATTAPGADSSPKPTAPYWCYVMTEVEVLSLDDHSQVVASLRPGNWYLTKREVGGWAQIAVEEGTEGWVPVSSINPHG